MADGTNISWAEATWNPITGCSVLSPGCKRCYAMRLAGTRMKHHPSRAGLTIDTPAGPVWNGEVRFNEQWLDQPLRWRKPRMIFVCAHADLFHENVPDEWIRPIFEVMFYAHQHIFMVLTKRTARARAFLSGRAHLRNVWIGASVEDQKHADERIPDLLATPAALHWISAEPLLGPVFIRDEWIRPDLAENSYGAALRWVVSGGESQGSDRPTHPAWARSLRDQCVAAGVPYHWKQWGDHRPAASIEEATSYPVLVKADPTQRVPSGCFHLPHQVEAYLDGTGELAHATCAMVKVGAKAAGRTLDGRIWDEFPERRSA